MSRTYAGYAAHDAAEMFPLMDDVALQQLADDIRRNGQAHPAVIHRGKLLDGRNRAAACELVGIPLQVAEFRGPSAVQYVISANLRRRHLSESVRSMLAANLLPHLQREATERQEQSRFHEGGPNPRSLSRDNDRQPEDPRSLSRDNNREEVGPRSLSPDNDRRTGRSNEIAARLLGVSPSSVARAKVVTENGADEVKAAVMEGSVPLATAADLARLPEKEQLEILRSVDPKLLKKAARKARLKDKDERNDNDAYYTPTDLAKAIVEAVGINHGYAVEPCAGGGAFVDAMRANGVERVWSCDIDSDATGAEVTANFLELTRADIPLPRIDWIVTNPPFLEAEAIVRHALSLVDEGGFVVMLLPVTFDGTFERMPFWDEHRGDLHREYKLVPRPSYTGDPKTGKGPTDGVEYKAYVFQPGVMAEWAPAALSFRLVWRRE